MNSASSLSASSAVSLYLDRIISWGLAGTIAFMALAHGAIEPWSATLAAGALLIFIELWAVRMAITGRMRLKAPAIMWPLVGLIIWGAVQGVSWNDGAGRRASLSLDVDATRGVVLWLSLLLGAGLLATNFWTSPQRLRQLGWFLSIYGFVLALFSLIQKFTWNGRFYWIRPGGDATAIFGPFINHNLYSGYLELLVPIPVGMLLARVVRGPARIFCAFAAVIMSISIIFSLSRGGMISLAALLLFVGVMGARVQMARRRDAEMDWDDEGFDEERSGEGWPESKRRLAWLPQMAAVGAIFIAILVGLLWLGPDTVASRLTQGELTGTDIQGQNFYASRGWIWRDTWSMFRDRPVTGVGLGAYETAFPRYTLTDGTFVVRQAHNDYLQILADGGLLGGALALGFLVIFFRALGRGLGSRDGWETALALGAGAGVFGVLIHSIFDFNLQIPGTALLFVVLASIVGQVGVGQSSGSAALATQPKGAMSR